MKPGKSSVAIYLLLVFLSGAVVGGLTYRFYTLQAVRADRPARSSDEYRRTYVEEMRARLNLTEPQIQKLNEILDETRNRYRQMRASVQQDHVERIRAILDETQRSEYEKMRQEREKHRQERNKHSH
jgi:cytidylate kinase